MNDEKSICFGFSGTNQNNRKFIKSHYYHQYAIAFIIIMTIWHIQYQYNPYDCFVPMRARAAVNKTQPRDRKTTDKFNCYLYTFMHV